MHDPSPEVSLKILERLCDAVDVYAAAVVLPGINDGEILKNTCTWLEERGAKGLILMRFANTTGQGLILGNAPLLKNQRVQTVADISDLVTDLNDQFGMKISGTPLWDPEIGSPFALLREPELMAKLPRVQRSATVISGRIASPFIQKVLTSCGFNADVVPVEKEIACLITVEDLKTLDPATLEPTVLGSDGVEREVVWGPEVLTADAETSMGMTRDQVLAIEMNGFADLIRTINMYGTEVGTCNANHAFNKNIKLRQS